MKLYLMANPERSYLFVAALADIHVEELPPASRIYDLGFALPSLPPGRMLMLISDIAPIFLQNVKPILETPP